MSKDVYYRLVDEQGALLPPTTHIDDIEAVLATTSTTFAVLRTRIINNSAGVLKDANIHDLSIYPSDSARRNNMPLDIRQQIGSYGDSDNPLIVVVASKALDVLVPGMEKLEVQIDSAEFQLDQLRAKVGTLVNTPTLHKLWAGFGEFPSSYYVRKEEEILWGVLKRQISSLDSAPVVVLGSHGVGKSCFLMLLAIYLACFAHRKVLVIRRAKGNGRGEAVVLLNGPKSVALPDGSRRIPIQRAVNLPLENISRIRKTNGLLVLVDGFAEDEIRMSRHLKVFDILATSYQYDRKENDPSQLVVLPAWRFDDLEQYAQHNRSWSEAAGYANMKNGATLRQLAAQQYALSGGSMRLFCMDRREVMDRITMDFRRVAATQTFALYTGFGIDPSGRLRRHYVQDPNNPEDYTSPSAWFMLMDSVHVLKELARCHIPTENHLAFYQCAASIGNGFQRMAHEVLTRQSFLLY